LETEKITRKPSTKCVIFAETEGLFFLVLLLTQYGMNRGVIEDMLFLELIVNYIGIYFVYLFGCIYLN
jgi:hypothetical protein